MTIARSNEPKEGGPESHGARQAALLFSPSQPRNAKNSAETARMSGKSCNFVSELLINDRVMEEKKFKNRTERLEWLDAQKGWGPLTEEEKAILDDAIRMVTNLDSKLKYAVSY